MSRTLVVVTLKAGRRSFVEERILEEMLAEDEKVGVVWGDGKRSGDPYHYRPIGPIAVEAINQFNGNHFIYGWLESLAQRRETDAPIYLRAIIAVEHRILFDPIKSIREQRSENRVR
jgi:hypothetical protein